VGFFRDWFDRSVRGGPSEMEEMMNPILGWRLQHFVCIPEDSDGWLRHYFMFLDKERVRREFIVFYAQTIGGYSYERTAYRKLPEDAYSLLSERGPWSMSITFLLDLGKQLPANTQSPQAHHAAGVSIERRPREPQPAPEPPPQPKKPVTTSHGFTVGEHVVYPKHGVGKLLAIEQLEIAGDAVEMFVVFFKNDNMTLRVPTDKIGAVGLRRLADEI